MDNNQTLDCFWHSWTLLVPKYSFFSKTQTAQHYTFMMPQGGQGGRDVEAEMSLIVQEEMTWATRVEQAFLTVYVVELLLRIAGVSDQR